MVTGTLLAEGRTREEETEEELDVAEEETEAGRGGRLAEETPLSPRFGTSWMTRPRDQGWHQGPPSDQPGPKSKA